MKKTKYFFALLAISAVIIAGASFSKVIIPSAIAETETSLSHKETNSLHSTKSTTTEAITRPVKENSTEAAATKENSTTTKSSDETSAQAVVQTSTEASKRTEEMTFPIQIPTLRLPELFIVPETELPTTASGEIDLSCFNNCAFVGNSRFLSFKNYGLAQNVYSVVGLNVDTVFTKSCSGSSVTVINELNDKNFDKIILMFGDNECGWPNQNIFIERYLKVIQAVRERVPDAEIYLHAILPVSADCSAENNYGLNNNTISALNQKIEQLASDEKIGYIAPYSSLLTEDGSLIPEAASDGVHLNKSYSKKWLFEIAEEIY